MAIRRASVLAGITAAIIMMSTCAPAGAEEGTQQRAPKAIPVGPLMGPGAATQPASQPGGNVSQQPASQPKPEPPPGVDFKPTNPPKFTPENYPRTDGSTSAQPLGAIIAYKLMDVQYAWVTRWHRSDRWIMPAALYDDFFGRRRPETPPDIHEQLAKLGKQLNHTGTHQAYVNVIEGKSDLAYICRVPSEDEIKLAKEKKVELEIVPVATDAFVFIVNEKSHLKGLTLQQVRDIFSGKTTNWKELGGPDAKINAYSRERNSGSQELMDKLVMKDLKMAELPGMEMMTMAGPYSALDRDEKGLSYTVYFYQKHMAMMGGFSRFERPPVRMIAIDGVEPTAQTIASGKYSLTADVYVVIRKDAAADSPARRLRDWLLTADGQALVAATEYVPAKVKH